MSPPGAREQWARDWSNDSCSHKGAVNPDLQRCPAEPLVGVGRHKEVSLAEPAGHGGGPGPGLLHPGGGLGVLEPPGLEELTAALAPPLTTRYRPVCCRGSGELLLAGQELLLAG